MKIWQVLCLVIVAYVLSACSSLSPRGDIVQPALPSKILTDYEIGVGDEISVQVWKAPELSVTVPVRPDGKISVPLLGDVQAAGETAALLSGTLANGLETFVRSPQVTVIVLDSSSADFLRRVRVTGAIAQPSSLEHQQGMTVLDVVLQAGGLTEFARGNAAKLYRKYGDKVEVYPIFLNDILHKGLLETNYTLAPSDIITIPERLF